MTSHDRIARAGAAPGLVLAAAIGAMWLTIHIGGIFFWNVAAGDWPLVAATILFQTWLSTGLFITAHDCMHGSLIPGNRRANAAIGTVCLAAYAGLSFAALLPKHHAHHAAPGTADDPDFHPDRPRDALVWFVRFFRGYYTHGQIVRISLAVALYWLLGATILNIVLFWAIPALLALVQLFVFGTYLPHRHGDEPFADRHHARSTRIAPIGSLITCFHFGGYHHEHHLSPGTPWWRLPSLRAQSPR